MIGRQAQTRIDVLAAYTATPLIRLWPMLSVCSTERDTGSQVHNTQHHTHRCKTPSSERKTKTMCSEMKINLLANSCGIKK